MNPYTGLVVAVDDSDEEEHVPELENGGKKFLFETLEADVNAMGRRSVRKGKPIDFSIV